MDAAALKLCCQFALGPNARGYCGKNTAPAKFKDCIKNGNCTGVIDELKKFIVLYPYLKTLGEITKLDPFSYEIVEAYWLGNDLLKKVQNSDYQILLNNFAGIPDWLLTELRQNPPKKFIPNHAFQVLFVGVGRASGSVPFNQESINNCLISLKGNAAFHWGKKVKILSAEEQEKLIFWTAEVKASLRT